MESATILVVENDPATRELVEAFLTQQGLRVLSEGEGEWALGVVEAEEIDLVVLDSRLSDLSGIEVLKRLRSAGQTAQLPVVLMGAPYAEPPPDLAELAPVTFLRKPVDLEAVQDAVRSNLRPRQPRPVVDHDAPGRGPIPSHGDLALTPFARLVGRLSERKARGALLLQKSVIKKVVFFDDGRPIFVQSNLLSESLGQVMLQERLVAEDELEMALSEKRRTGRPLGDVLVGNGTISEHNLAFALERQMERKLFDLFSWLEGTYRYRPSARYSGPRVTLPFGAVGLVYEGAARTMSTDRIERDLAPERHRVVRATRPNRVRDAVLALEPGAGSLVDRLDGTETLEALFLDKELGRAEAVQLVYALVVTGQVALSEPGPPVLSDALREQVRARLDAEMRRIESAQHAGSSTLPRARVRPLRPDEAEVLRRELEAQEGTLTDKTYFEVLGVERDATEDQIRSAYRRCGRDLDPGRLFEGKNAPGLLRRAESNHLRAVRAFQVLIEPAARRRYEAWTETATEQRLMPLRIDDGVQGAWNLLGSGQVTEAEQALFEMTRVDPGEPYLRAAHAYVKAMADGNLDDALATIAGLTVGPSPDPDILLLRGQLLQSAGRDEEAEETYREVLELECSPEALRAVASLDRGDPPRSMVERLSEQARALFGRPSD